MYCMNCGTKNNDQSKFCIKCGQQLTENVVAEKKTNPAKRKTKTLMVLVSLVLVATIFIATIFELWPWSTKADKEVNDIRAGMDDIQKGEQGASNNGVITFENFSLNAIAEQCPDCQAAVKTYIEMLKVSQDWMTSKEEIEVLENQKCAQMQHFCTANSIYVENIPYAFHGSFGLYTGDWIGAGPSGKGTYTGTVYDTNLVTYTGDWGFGLPNGEGQLYLENYLGNWDMTYTGEMKNGMRDGVGSWFEYCDDGYHEAKFRVYDTATYSQDKLTQFIDCAEYYADTGEIYQYCKMSTDELGRPVQGKKWGPDELRPEMENALGIAGALCIVGVTAYMTGELVKSVTDPHYADSVYKGQTREEQSAELNQYFDQKKAEEQERMKREEKKMERNKAIAWDEMKKLEASGDYGSLEHQKYETISNTGIWN